MLFTLENNINNLLNFQVASEVIVGKYKAKGILPITLKF